MKNYLVILLIICSSCDFIEKNFTSTPEKEESQGIKTFYANGKLKSHCFTDDTGKKHGDCKSYYENGNLKNVITYEHGRKTRGVSHYKEGGAALDIQYKNGLKNGLRRKFYQNGKIASEFDYKDNLPGKGLREYNKNGKLLTKYPKLILKPHDLIESHGKYYIEIFFDRNEKRGEYYIGELDSGKYLGGPNLILLPETDGIGRYSIQVPRGYFNMETLNFVGKYKTPRGNPYIVEKKFNLAVENPY